MTMNPSKSTTPFASINDVSYYQDEDEILFAMHSVFRIRDITSMDENNRLFRVDLTLTSDIDKDLHMLTDRIRQETFQTTKDGNDWVYCYSKWVNLARHNKFMKYDYATQLFKVKKHLSTINLDGPNLSKENINKQLHSLKNHLKFTKNLASKLF
jgi:hypothetical protein